MLRDVHFDLLLMWLNNAHNLSPPLLLFFILCYGLLPSPPSLFSLFLNINVLPFIQLRLQFQQTRRKEKKKMNENRFNRREKNMLMYKCCQCANKKATQKISRFITLPKIAKLFGKLFSKFILVSFPIQTGRRGGTNKRAFNWPIYLTDCLSILLQPLKNVQRFILSEKMPFGYFKAWNAFAKETG